MADDNNATYYAMRARQCLASAQRTIDPDIAAVHLELHQRYVQRLQALEADGLVVPPALASIRGH